jgi:hypothetical protein
MIRVNNWHWSRLLLCWIVGGLQVWIAYHLGTNPPEEQMTELKWAFVAGTISIVVLSAVIAPLVLTAVTWKWFRRAQSVSQEENKSGS